MAARRRAVPRPVLVSALADRTGFAALGGADLMIAQGQVGRGGERGPRARPLDQCTSASKGGLVVSPTLATFSPAIRPRLCAF